MGEFNAEMLAKLRTALRLPADTPPAKVAAAFETDAIRRAGRVGLPWKASLPEIEKAEIAATAATSARRVAAAQMLGHSSPVVEEWHPALQPVHRVPQNHSMAIDWAAMAAEVDE